MVGPCAAPARSYSMVSVKCDSPRWSMDSEGNMLLMLRVDPGHHQAVKALVGEFKGKPYRVDVRQWRDKRSKNANDLCWELCAMLANETGLTKEDVYRHSIREVGVYEALPLREDAIDRFKEAWESRGIGWFIEVVDDSKFQGYKKVFAYYGSSKYDTKEMSRLIDNLMQDAEALGLVVDQREASLLKEAWDP